MIAFRKLYLMYFYDQKYITVFAKKGKEALDLLENGLKPKLIISELNTPKIFGFQLYKF